MLEGRRMKILRSIAAVIVSYFVVFMLVSLSDPALAMIYPGQYVRGAVPPAFLLRLSTYMFAIASILGGVICARFAPSRPGLHLFALFLLGEAIGLGFTVSNWNKGWPHWYSLVWLAVWPVCLYLGGLMKLRQDRKKAAAAAA
jgi:nitrate/nitrite transporter NarK